MTDGSLLLAAILDSPDADDTLRLAYADWLDENGGGARAEFIRVQVTKYALEAEQGSAEFWDVIHTQHRACHGCSPWCRLFQRECFLWGVVGESFDTLGLHSRLPWEKCEGEVNTNVVRRGFVASVRLPAADWEAHGDNLLAAHPVRAVRFTDRVPTVGVTDAGPGDRFLVAGRLVTSVAPDGTGLPAILAAFESSDPEEQLTRLVLSARWPRVPPEGWSFPSRAGTSFDPAGHPTGVADGSGGVLTRSPVPSVGWDGPPPVPVPLDEIRRFRERLAERDAAADARVDAATAHLRDVPVVPRPDR